MIEKRHPVQFKRSLFSSLTFSFSRQPWTCQEKQLMVLMNRYTTAARGVELFCRHFEVIQCKYASMNVLRKETQISLTVAASVQEAYLVKTYISEPTPGVIDKSDHHLEVSLFFYYLTASNNNPTQHLDTKPIPIPILMRILTGNSFCLIYQNGLLYFVFSTLNKQ